MNSISSTMTALGISAFIPSILPFFKTIFGALLVDLPLELAALF